MYVYMYKYTHIYEIWSSCQLHFGSFDMDKDLLRILPNLNI